MSNGRHHIQRELLINSMNQILDNTNNSNIEDLNRENPFLQKRFEPNSLENEDITTSTNNQNADSLILNGFNSNSHQMNSMNSFNSSFFHFPTFNNLNNSINNSNNYISIPNQFTSMNSVEFAAEREILTQNLDDLKETMTYLIGTEKTKIKSEKAKLLKDIDDFKQEFQLKQIHHKRNKHQYQINSLQANSIQNNTTLIELNIGGTHSLTTTIQTLTQYKQSALAKMFSGKYTLPKHNGKIFIDRDGAIFSLMLNYLRNKMLPTVFTNEKERILFYDELDYWQLPLNPNNDNNDSNINKVILSPFNFDKDWCAETLVLGDNTKMIRKSNELHGIVFLTPTLSEDNPYLEFKVCINSPSGGKSSLFIGLVDKSLYKYENLMSSYWKDCPSSYYWDAWNTKLIKIDKNGQQIGSLIGYGCQCENKETIFGMFYNSQNKTIEFYKDYANLGIAFRDVPNGLTPSLDIWFEFGYVEITNRIFPDQQMFL